MENLAVATGLGKSDFIPISKKGNAKKHSNYRTIALISHISKVVLKILQARFQQYVNHKFPDVQAGFRKSRGDREQVANICWIIEKVREFQEKNKNKNKNQNKKTTSSSLTMTKSLTVWITINCEKF